MTAIKLKYRSCDGFSESKTFKTLKGARRYATKMVGASPDIGTYAVSSDGIGTIRVVEGTTLAELFA